MQIKYTNKYVFIFQVQRAELEGKNTNLTAMINSLETSITNKVVSGKCIWILFKHFLVDRHQICRCFRNIWIWLLITKALYLDVRVTLNRQMKKQDLIACKLRCNLAFPKFHCFSQFSIPVYTQRKLKSLNSLKRVLQLQWASQHLIVKYFKEKWVENYSSNGQHISILTYTTTTYHSRRGIGVMKRKPDLFFYKRPCTLEI